MEQLFKLNNVRLSFPALFQHETFNGESTGKFGATFILDKKLHADVISEIKRVINKGMADELKVKSLPPDKLCLRDGDVTGRSEYVGAYIFRATTKKRPTVVDRDKTPLVEEDDKPYSGCYVNAIVDLWYQNNAFGKRVNGNLLGVQFYKDGDAFGTGPIDVANKFDDYDQATNEW